jgi:hypothetical protein
MSVKHRLFEGEYQRMETGKKGKDEGRDEYSHACMKIKQLNCVSRQRESKKYTQIKKRKYTIYED